MTNLSRKEMLRVANLPRKEMLHVANLPRKEMLRVANLPRFNKQIRFKIYLNDSNSNGKMPVRV